MCVFECFYGYFFVVIIKLERIKKNLIFWFVNGKELWIYM
jgi:hypothetical protein